MARYARSPHLQPVGGPIRDSADLVDEFLRLACLTYDASTDSEARRDRARQLLAEHPELATATIHTIATVGDVAAARARLAEDPALARREGGPHDWEPLLYLAYSRVDSTRPGHSTLETARLLLEHAADPNAGYLWEGHYPFTALTGAFGRGEGDPPPHRYSLELARLLLEAGADPNDSQAIYNHAWSPGDEWLELLLEHGLGTGSGGPWHARLGSAHPTPTQLVQDALVWAAYYENAERVRLLLGHGAEVDGRGTEHPLVEGHKLLAELGFDVNFRKRRTALHEAAVNGNLELVRLLIELGADPTIEDSSYHATPLGWAEHGNQPQVAEYLATRDRGVH